MTNPRAMKAAEDIRHDMNANGPIWSSRWAAIIARHFPDDRERLRPLLERCRGTSRALRDYLFERHLPVDDLDALLAALDRELEPTP